VWFFFVLEMTYLIKQDQIQVQFLEDLVLFLAKGFNFPLNTCENLWMCRLALKLDPGLVVPFHRTLFEDILPFMVVHYMNLHVWPLLDATQTIITTFDSWTNWGQQNTFALVINFPTIDWKHYHVTIGPFETNDTIGQGLAKQLNMQLEWLLLASKVLCFVKKKKNNLA